MLLQFLNDHSSQRTRRFVVMPDFDHTPDPRLPADNYLTTRDIIHIIKTIYMPPPSGSDTDWMVWYDYIGPMEANAFFTAPNYPLAAVSQLGYPRDDDNLLFPEEDE